MAWPETNVDIAVMRGGLNLAAQPLSLEKGEAIQLHNYEVDEFGRYRRVAGYERFDGNKRPSEQPYFTLTVDDASSFSALDAVVGSVSGAAGTVVAVSLANNMLALVDLVGNFQIGEAANGATVVQPTLRNYAPDVETEDAFALATVEHFRGFIGPVPGAGAMLGVVMYRDKVYAFRNTADQTACKMYKSSATGWVEVSTPVLAPNGIYKFRIHNFGGANSHESLIGVDGENKAFLYDDVTYTQITTGMSLDTPTALEVLSTNILLLGYQNGSLILSSLGDPLDYNVANGAGEIAVGDAIMDMDVQPDRTTAIFCKSSIRILYGAVKSDMQMTTLDSNTSSSNHAMRSLGDTVFVTERGISRLQRVQQFGDFDTMALSGKVKPLLDKLKSRVVGSFVVRSKGQYRLCFDNRLMIICTFAGNEVAGFSTADYGMVIRCAYEALGESGMEEIYFGSDDGFIYQAEKGNSFDGNPVRSIVRLAFNTLGSPEHRKRFKKLAIEMATPTQVSFLVLPNIDYIGAYTPEAAISELLSVTGDLIIAYGGASFFDEAAWGEARWSTSDSWMAELYLTAVGQRISPAVLAESLNSPPHTLNAILLHWASRGRKR